MTAMRSEENGIRPAFAGKEQEAQKSLRAQRPERSAGSFDPVPVYHSLRSRTAYRFRCSSSGTCRVPVAGRSPTTTTMYDTTESRQKLARWNSIRSLRRHRCHNPPGGWGCDAFSASSAALAPILRGRHRGHNCLRTHRATGAGAHTHALRNGCHDTCDTCDAPRKQHAQASKRGKRRHTPGCDGVVTPPGGQR